MADSSRAKEPFGLRAVLRTLLVVWALFWTTFSVASGLSEGLAGLSHFAMVVVLAFLVLAAWFQPVTGGWALVVAGVGAALSFDHLMVRILLAGPALLLGLAFVLTAPPGRLPP